MTCKAVGSGGRTDARQRGVAAMLAMMFLLVFSSLAAAMAIVAQGNLSIADAHLKVNRSLSAAETGMMFIIYRLNEVTTDVRTIDGVIDQQNAAQLWELTQEMLIESLRDELHNLEEPTQVDSSLHIGPISLGAGEPPFHATFTAHPIGDEDYDSSYYDRTPYTDLAVSEDNPLDTTWIRVRVEAHDGPEARQITRAIEMDFHMDKKIRFAILSKNRIMIGRHVLIEGPVGSRFSHTHLAHGHPVQMVSDFVGLTDHLDDDLQLLRGSLIELDQDGDNRLALDNPAETAGLDAPANYDTSGDGHIDEYDMFLDHYDTNGDHAVSAAELDVDRNIATAQLLRLIDTFGDPERDGFNDGQIDAYDRYAKVRGQVLISADLNGWQNGAADPAGDGSGAYQDFFQGPIKPHHNQAPLTFQATDSTVHQFEATDFDVSSFKERTAPGSFTVQVNQQLEMHHPDNPATPQFPGTTVEAVPFGAAHPYDFYERPVYENMTFRDVRIPKGTNALFRNCRFIGVTFVDTTTDNEDPNYNLAGTQEVDGSLKHPDKTSQVSGVDVADTKTVANNLRFDSCRFDGAVVTEVPLLFAHARNKIAFTGQTRFVIDESDQLSDEERQLFKRSTILAPHYSIEMGTFLSPDDPNETVELSGTIVAGVLDVRGQVQINGTILTTFEPVIGEPPVLGESTPQFNTTLGYFDSASGDLEAELPSGSMGRVQIRYDPTLPLPDGILGPIEIAPVFATYRETGAR